MKTRTNPIRHWISVAIEDRMADRRITPPKLAELTGLGIRSLNAGLNEENDIPTKTLMRLLDELGMPPDAFFRAVGRLAKAGSR